MLKVPREAATVGSLELKVRGNLAGMSTGVDNHICPYFQILRYVEGAFEPMYRSKVVRNTDRPQFEDVHLPPHHVAHLIQEDVYIKFEVFDLESRGDPRCLGAIETSMSRMLADGERNREKTGRSVARWNGCHYLLGPRDTRKGELAKPVDTAPKGRPSIKIGALYDDHRQKEAEAEAAKNLSRGGMAQEVKLTAPKQGMHKSGRRKLKPASALEAEGTASFGTFGEDERFLANLMMEQNIRETDLREVVDESLQYIDERRTHWLTETGKLSANGGGSGSNRVKPKQSKGGRGADLVSSGMGAVLDWGDTVKLSPPKPKTRRAKEKEAARKKRCCTVAANIAVYCCLALLRMIRVHVLLLLILARCCAFCVHRVPPHCCRAELAAKSTARKQAKAADADTGSQTPVRDIFSERQMAAVPHTNAYEQAAKDRKTQRRAVDNSRSAPELGSKEYNVDDWQDDGEQGPRSGTDRSPGPHHEQDDHAAAHGVLPRLNITQRWDTFDISARCAPT